jgi:hypothetical protein
MCGEHLTNSKSLLNSEPLWPIQNADSPKAANAYAKVLKDGVPLFLNHVQSVELLFLLTSHALHVVSTMVAKF